MTIQMLNDRYQVIRTLGAGGFGETYLAEDTYMPSKRRCVVKQLRPIQNNPQIYQLVQERFQREAAILEELGGTTDQIPGLYAYFCAHEQFYLVQEWIEGDTLSTKLQQEGLWDENVVHELLINLLPVLTYVHSKQIIHRDIKPDNIILRYSDRKPVLIDFGAVRESMGTVMTAQGNTTSSIVIGTPGYMPSEQAAGRAVYSSDLYSLGLTIVYLLTGMQPSQLETDSQTGEIIWRKYAPKISPVFASVIERSLAYHPRDRFSTATAMLNALQNLVNSIPATEAIIPSAKANIPETEAIIPSAKANIPETEAIIPSAKANIPETEAIIPPTKATSNQTKAVTRPAKKPLADTPIAKPVVTTPTRTQVNVKTKVQASDNNRNTLILGGLIASGLIGSSVILSRVLTQPATNSKNTTSVISSSNNTPAVTETPAVATSPTITNPSPSEQPTAVDNANVSKPTAQQPSDRSPKLLENKQASSPPSPITPPSLPEALKSPKHDPYFWLTQRHVTNADLAGKNGFELDIMRNTIFAFHGRSFDDPGIQEYFNHKPWYSPKYSQQKFPARKVLTKLEVRNIAHINKYQDVNNLRFFNKNFDSPFDFLVQH